MAHPKRSKVFPSPMVMSHEPFRDPIEGKWLSTPGQVKDFEKKWGVRQAGELKSVKDFDWTANAEFKSALED